MCPVLEYWNKIIWSTDLVSNSKIPSRPNHSPTAQNLKNHHISWTVTLGSSRHPMSTTCKCQWRYMFSKSRCVITFYFIPMYAQINGAHFIKISLICFCVNSPSSDSLKILLAKMYPWSAHHALLWRNYISSQICQYFNLRTHYCTLLTWQRLMFRSYRVPTQGNVTS